MLLKSYTKLKNRAMTKGNNKKAEQLGMPYGTASNRLRKLILFKLLQECGKDTCYRCGKKIENPNELSIEHKINWLDSDNPVEIFFDLENIAFSHLSCNSRAATRNKELLGEQQRKLCRKGIHPLNHLTEKDVIEIRELLNRGVRQIDIAKQFNISKFTVSRIKTGKIFNYI